MAKEDRVEAGAQLLQSKVDADPHVEVKLNAQAAQVLHVLADQPLG